MRDRTALPPQPHRYHTATANRITTANPEDPKNTYPESPGYKSALALVPDMNLSDATWTDADAAATDLALLPIGSTEQHGPHAPLGTDHITAEAVAEAGAAAYESEYGSAGEHDGAGEPDGAGERDGAGEVVVAPAIPVGVAAEHRQFTGTLWVSPDTFRDYVRETVASLAHHGWDRVVLVNGHGGNVAALREVAGTITREDDAYAVPFTWFEAVGEYSDRMGHGGPLETALLRQVAPDLVREDRVEEAREGASAGWGDWVSYSNLAFDSAEFSENGVVGDPGDGDAALGEELLELAGAALADLLAAVESRDVSRPPHK